MQMTTIPRTYVRVALRTARLPISTAELLVRHDTAWPPALAFDAFAATVEQVVGSVLSDDKLVRDGRLRQTRVAERRDAVRLATLAEQADHEATQTFEARRQADEHKRQAASQKAQKRGADAGRKQREANAAIDAKAHDRRAQARKVDEDRKQTLAEKRRTAKKASINKERQSVAKAKAAAQAKSRVLDADKKIRATKATRKSA